MEMRLLLYMDDLVVLPVKYCSNYVVDQDDYWEITECMNPDYEAQRDTICALRLFA